VAIRFPIVGQLDRQHPADTANWREIKRLSARHRAAINHLQPHIKRNDHWRETRARLAVLSTLNNIDKHRRLHLARRINAPVPQPELFPSHSGFRQTVFPRALEAGTYVERWTFTEPPADQGSAGAEGSRR
jgi:hypothetical protein